MGSTWLDGDTVHGGGRVGSGQQGQGREDWMLIAISVQTLSVETLHARDARTG